MIEATTLTNIMGGVVIIAVGYFLFHLIFRKKGEPFVPPVIDNPVEEGGILLGKYYGHQETERCVTVISVENGIVAFRYSTPRSAMASLPQEAFVQQFYKYPNGCPFDSNEPKP